MLALCHKNAELYRGGRMESALNNVREKLTLGRLMRRRMIQSEMDKEMLLINVA
jgi:hypothetical protein